jgi:hypothetical protein
MVTCDSLINFSRLHRHTKILVHDPEKWEQVFGKDHAQAKMLGKMLGGKSNSTSMDGL